MAVQIAVPVITPNQFIPVFALDHVTVVLSVGSLQVPSFACHGLVELG